MVLYLLLLSAPIIFFFCWCSHELSAAVAFLPNMSRCALRHPRAGRQRAGEDGFPPFGRDLGFRVICYSFFRLSLLHVGAWHFNVSLSSKQRLRYFLVVTDKPMNFYNLVQARVNLVMIIILITHPPHLARPPPAAQTPWRSSVCLGHASACQVLHCAGLQEDAILLAVLYFPFVKSVSGLR